MSDLDFKGISAYLLKDAIYYLHKWMPGGKLVGREYQAGTVNGGPGNSCSVNVETGLWSDFATGDKGGDLVSLFAASERIKQGDAFKILSKEIDIGTKEIIIPKKQSVETIITAPPQGVIRPKMEHMKHGLPSKWWSYTDKQGYAIFYIARYETKEGKVFSPWAWSQTHGKWVQKGFPAPRPIYNLHGLEENKVAPVLVVEGEKAAEAAKKICGRLYVVTTWPNGSQSFDKSDWSPLHGRAVLIWPDCDASGIKAANGIAKILHGKANQVKIIATKDKPDGWDADDAASEGWGYKEFLAWGKPLVYEYKPIKETEQIKTQEPERIEEPPIEDESSTQTEIIEPFEPKVNNYHIENFNVSTDIGEEDKHEAVKYNHLGLAVNKQNVPYINIDNMMRVIERTPELKDNIWYDEFHKKIFTSWSGKIREWADIDTLKLTMHMQRHFGLSKINDEIAFKGIVVYSRKNMKNEPKDWIATLQWDKEPRVLDFFCKAFGAQPSQYCFSVAQNFWVGMIARIFQPGCQLDNMVVLEGAQGAGKTSALRMIGGKWHTEAHESVTNKDFFMVLNGKLIVEIAELDSFSRAEVTRIKQVISCPTDRYRTPYGRAVEDNPRMSVFVGTTNERTYLKDTTGGRRFWPVTCRVIDHLYIKDNRDQLFAEALHLYQSGTKWHVMPWEETLKEQEERRQHDEWESIIDDYVRMNLLEDVTVTQIATECLKIDIGKIDRHTQTRIGSSLRALGYQSKSVYTDHTTRRVWRRSIPLSADAPLNISHGNANNISAESSPVGSTA